MNDPNDSRKIRPMCQLIEAISKKEKSKKIVSVIKTV